MYLNMSLNADMSLNAENDFLIFSSYVVGTVVFETFFKFRLHERNGFNHRGMVTYLRILLIFAVAVNKRFYQKRKMTVA